jgi:hypothetical protein
VLALQRNAGNQAVGAILARFKSEENTGRRRTTLELDGLGTVDAESVSPRGGQTRYAVTLRGHSLTAQLAAAARNGTIIDTARIVVGNMRIELKGVVIAGLEMNGEMISLELDASSAEVKYGPDAEDKDEDTASPRLQSDAGEPPSSG